MSRTLFLGDSHSAGYTINEEGRALHWTENNYAEIYSAINNIQCAIYAQAGGCNRKFPTWLSCMLNLYDIDKVFIQSTHWNRYLVANDPNLDLGESYKVDAFLERNEDSANGLVHRYTDKRYAGNRYEALMGQFEEYWDKYKGFKGSINNPQGEFDILENQYRYTKLWHEALTHLQLRDYIGDMTVIDHMVRNTNIPVYVWTINNRIHLPKNTELYRGFDNVKFVYTSAEDFLFERHRMKISKMVVADKEHYNYDVHSAIAEHYLPYIEKNY